MRILITDDDPDSAESLKLNLEDIGYQVDVAPTAGAAMGLCVEHGYGVIFLDLGLPDRSGVELLPDLQKLNPEAEILVLTANTSIAMAAKAVNRGASMYLPKPIEDIAYVLRMVQRAEKDIQFRQQIEFQTLVLRNVQEAVVAITLDKRVSYWNRGAESLYGWTESEMIDGPIDRILPEYEDITDDIPPDGSARVTETFRKRRDGTYIEVEERVHTLRDAAGNVIGYLALARDITERKQAERKEADLVRREHTIAVTFQRALLPDVPERRPGLEIGRLYAPAWKDADVGGDFYDWLPLRDKGTALVLGDVSGKGLSAGVLMSLIRNVISAYADEDERPHTVLHRTNEHLAKPGRIPDERFVTVFYATFNPADYQIAYGSAGHEPAIVLHKDGSVDLLRPTGPMIGLDSGMEFSCEEYSFLPGDLMLIYTDGATEAGSPDNFLGTEGLIALLKEHQHLPVDRLVERLHQAILEHSGGFSQDDLAMLCLRSTPL